jgi:hypothetical protein
MHQIIQWPKLGGYWEKKNDRPKFKLVGKVLGPFLASSNFWWHVNQVFQVLYDYSQFSIYTLPEHNQMENMSILLLTIVNWCMSTSFWHVHLHNIALEDAKVFFKKKCFTQNEASYKKIVIET